MRRSGLGGQRRGVLLAGALMAITLLAAGCGDTDSGTGGGGGSGGTAPGSTIDAATLLGSPSAATGAPVKIGLISDGKSAASDQAYELDVVKGTAQYLNEYKKGLAGHEIEVVSCVTTGDPGKTTDCANEMVKEQVVAVVGGSLQAGENVFQPLHDAKIPVVYYAAGSAKVILDKDASFVLSSATGPLIDVPMAAAKAAGKNKVTVVLIDVPAATAIYETLGKQLFQQAGVELALVKIAPGTADMTPQMQTLTSTDPGDVHMLGTDAFCISVLQGLKAVGYDGPRSMVSQCLSDATLKAIPGPDLAGIKVATAAPIGTDDPGVQTFNAIMAKYAPTAPTEKVGAVGIYQAIASLALVLENYTGELTPANITAAMKSAPEMDIPAGGGVGFRCDGKASSLAAAVCAQASLVTSLGDTGQPTTFELLNDTPIS